MGGSDGVYVGGGAIQLKRPATFADEKDIEFQLAHTCIYI